MNLTLSNIASEFFGVGQGWKSIKSINNDIRDELNFHLECRCDELVAEGMTPDEARQLAETEFGSLDRIRKSCQRAHYGARIWWHRSLLLGLCCAFLAIGLMAWQLVSVQAENSDLMARLNSISKVNTPAGATLAAIGSAEQRGNEEDFEGTVKDADGNPVSDAKVTLILKSWPGNRFRMDNFVTETNDKGKFSFEDLYDKRGEAQFLVSVVKDGYLLSSEYIDKKANRTVKSVKFALKPASEKTLLLIGEDGEPLANAAIAFLGRKPKRGKEQMIYPVSAEDVSMMTDDDGKISANFFAEGDQIRLYLVDENDSREVVINDEKIQTVSLSNSYVVGGSVKDQNGNAVVDAKIVLLYKSWPNNRFQMNTFDTETDDKGQFSFAGVAKNDIRSQIMVSVVADGFAMVGDYIDNPSGKPLDAFEYKLEDALDKTFKLDDGGATNFAGAEVYLKNRKNPDRKGSDFMIYPVSKSAVAKQADENGEVMLNHVIEGDTITLAVTKGGTTHEVELQVDDQPIQKVNPLKKKQRRFR